MGNDKNKCGNKHRFPWEIMKPKMKFRKPMQNKKNWCHIILSYII